MHNRVLAVAAFALGLAAVSAAEPLEGRGITLHAGAHAGQHVPVSIAYDGLDAENTVFVTEEGVRGRRYPATARAGTFVFIPEGVSPNTNHSYTVHVSKKKPSLVTVEKQKSRDELEVRVDGELFTAYHYSNDHRKPYLWPVNGEGGVTLTRDWPMGERDRTGDHRHHTSFWTAHGDLNGADCWLEEPGSGYQHAEQVTWGSGGAYGWIHAKNVWQDKDHNPVVAEEREYRFYASPPGARIFDVFVRFTARYGDVTFGDTKEGGLVSVRMNDRLRERGGSGTITTSTGAVGERDAWGKPAAWCDYSGVLDDAGSLGLAVFDHPANFRHPTSWHVRGYGLMAANCFGYSHFTQGKENGEYVLKEGETLAFTFRIYVHSGDVNEASVAERYLEFASPPQAAWAD